jgi:hypothetical protein
MLMGVVVFLDDMYSQFPAACCHEVKVCTIGDLRHLSAPAIKAEATRKGTPGCQKKKDVERSVTARSVCAGTDGIFMLQKIDSTR